MKVDLEVLWLVDSMVNRLDGNKTTKPGIICSKALHHLMVNLAISFLF